MSARMDIFDPRVAPVVRGMTFEKLCTGAVWGEGPVWLDNTQSLLWSDIPNNRMLSWNETEGLSVWADQVEFTNGHCLDNDGSLLHCSHGQRAVVRTPLVNGQLKRDTPMQVVVDRYQDKRLNSPNDVVVKRNGSIWFTDPPYGILSDREGHQATPEQAANHVFRFDPKTQSLQAATDWLDEPNGLAFSPDEKRLYVSDTSAALRPAGQGHHHIVVFEVDEQDQLNHPRVFADINPGLADGFRIDAQGWLYTSSEDSVQIYHPDGSHMAKLYVPEKVGNLTFGGRLRNQLYVVASSSLYRITLNTQGNPSV
ncbi:SMP-30/gluconolactonase/LRE family protein [Limnohabitans sp.]|uniref:SMP-30/gluconolactonase/LRE family protein n=1 Tax=Limnohabitans sp. TaxID=1907725 RepID=UPI00286EC88A|nr:SMP-30/gluconolactonase/LRE family protein [Limnohabitans sp.]